MKDIELYRMNFLNLRHKAFTYKQMLYVAAAWMVMLGFVTGFLMFRATSLRGSAQKAAKNLEMMNKQKDQQLKLVETVNQRQGIFTIHDDLAAILMNRPQWSLVLRSLTRSLPPQVWLESVAVVNVEGKSNLEIKGRAKSQRALTSFIMEIESQGMFKRTELAEAKRAEGTDGVFTFVINTTPLMKKL